RWQAEGGRGAWPAARVWQWSDWLGQLWLMASTHAPDVCAQAGALLNRLQERALWERVIRDTPQAQELVQVGDVAATACTVWRTVNAWQMPMDSPEWQRNTDARAFASWSKRYQAACAEGGFLDPGRLPVVLAQQIEKRSFPLPSRVLLAGFDDLDKQQQALLESLRASGSTILQNRPSGKLRCARRAAFADPYAEVTAAARWIRQWLTRYPKHSVGVAVADLDAYRPLIRSRFHEILAPGTMLPDGFAEPLCFEIPTGRALLDYPLVQGALKALALLDDPVNLEALGSLLRSPYLAGAEREMSCRALLDAKLRKTGEPTVTLRAVRDLAGEKRPWRCPVLGQALERLQRQRERSPLSQSPAAWTHSFTRLLSSMGWPGERSLSSEEYQTAQAWDELLQAFASLSCITPALSCKEALNRLRLAARERAYQPEEPEAPVSVMDLSETQGLGFDALWILGLHDGRWPPAAEPLPFIPLPLQYQAEIPQASAERSLAQGFATTERLMGCAAAVVLSYPQCEAEIGLAPSPLIMHIPPMEDVPELFCEEYSRSIQRCARLEPYEDAIAPPFPSHTGVRGGAGLIREQARCPFRAFATHRLGARPLGAIRLGLDPARRGKLVHTALETLWATLGSQAALLKIS
ncbi:MAG: hypothetical protein L0099_16885, partial [Acidobacteria bacterium]|nr:hypothetical protein [Acidobacteriota bacterium]